jgi:pimeloyl-ACP methyl ester carboxylesterase
MDLSGHGHSSALGRRFRLEQCADDVAELADALHISSFVPVGYSMGGLIAQLVWHRHRHLVSGLVLCSTARNFQGSPLEQMTSLMLPGIASWMQLNPVLHLIGSGALGMSLLGHFDDPGLDAWAHQQMERTSLATTVAAMDEVTRFTSHSWVSAIDVPCSIVVTTRDRIVPAARQRRLAAEIGDVTVYEIDAGHDVCVREPARFATALLGACHSVANTPAATR